MLFFLNVFFFLALCSGLPVCRFPQANVDRAAKRFERYKELSSSVELENGPRFLPPSSSVRCSSALDSSFLLRITEKEVDNARARTEESRSRKH
jgi:hypothetical protein